MRKDSWEEMETALVSPKEYELARRVLKDDPAELAELEGLRSFRDEIRTQGLTVPVPISRLERRLSETIRQNASRSASFLWLRVAIPVGAVILVAGGVWWLRQDPMNFAITATAEVLEAPSEAEAESWIEAHTKFDIPKLKFPRESVLVTARYGKGGDWACMDFVHHGQTYWLYVNRTGKQLQHGRVQTFDGRKFYDGQGIGWKSNNLAFYLKGGDHADRWKFATFLAPQTQS